MYLEGSDQHRGWFQSSLLESCGTRGRAPFDIVLTHGFVLDENGRKMSKSLGNVVAPQDVIKESGADILRMWVCAADYADDLRIGAEILKTTVETYRKLRNTLRWMLGNLAHLDGMERVAPADMPDLERLMLHRLAELDLLVRAAYAEFDYKRIFAALNVFLTVDLSAFYFDIRKDALYCDPYSSLDAQSLSDGARPSVPRHGDVARADPLLHRRGGLDGARSGSAPRCISSRFRTMPAAWRDDALAERGARSAICAVSSPARSNSSGRPSASDLRSRPRPVIYVADPELFGIATEIDLAELCITSDAMLVEGEGPASAFRLDDVPNVSVEPRRAEGRKCARSWKISPAVGSDPQYPDVTPRDAQALREWDAMRRAAE